MNDSNLNEGSSASSREGGKTSNSFSKQERLSSKKLIDALFKGGKSFVHTPFRVILLANPNQSFPVHQVLVSVPVKNFKRAVDRNLIKRRMREAYRLNKSSIASSTKLLLAYIYIAKEIVPYTVIEEKMVKSFALLK